mmetsp:Transcript_2657/g.7943  ORF Transcript_2657/g.7943 Transcript_2657/m.7943 type:complete len:243 (-) Transcript_2657:236-964(-)
MRPNVDDLKDHNHSIKDEELPVLPVKEKPPEHKYTASQLKPEDEAEGALGRQENRWCDGSHIPRLVLSLRADEGSVENQDDACCVVECVTSHHAVNALCARAVRQQGGQAFAGDDGHGGVPQRPSPGSLRRDGGTRVNRPLIETMFRLTGCVRIMSGRILHDLRWVMTEQKSLTVFSTRGLRLTQKLICQFARKCNCLLQRLPDNFLDKMWVGVVRAVRSGVAPRRILGQNTRVLVMLARSL